MASENSLAQLYDDYMDGIQVIEIDGVKESFDDYQKRMGGIDYESKAHGGSVGIEILFGPKRDNFRYGGDTMGGKNDKSKSSPGPDRSRVSAQQQANHDRAMAAAQGSGGGISNLTNNINKTTFLDNVKNKVDMVVDNPLTKFLDPRSKIALAMGGYKFLRDGIPKLKDFENEAINQELKNIQTMGGISPYADGGRVGFFMGGPALEGEALSIYNSMKAYGNDDQAIADKLQSLGMYTPGGSTPDTPQSVKQLGYSGGDNGGGITTLEPLTRKSNPDNFLNKAFSKIGDFTGSMMDKFSDTKVGEGITEGATKFKNIAITPMMALMNKRNPLNPDAMNYNPALQPQMDFLEGQTGTKVSGMPDNLQFTDGLMMIGRDPNSGLTKYGPGSVLSGKNVVSGFGTNDYGDMLRDYITKMEANTRISQAGKDARLALARAELAAEQERQRQAYIDSGTQKAVKDLQKEIVTGKYSGGSDFAQRNQAAVGGGAKGKAANTDNDKSTGTSQGYSQHYARGGLATMFTRRR